MRFQTDIFLIYLNLFRYIERQKSVYFYKLRHRNWLSTLKRLNVSEKGRYVRPGVNHIIGATVHKILQFEKSSEKVSNWNCGKRGQKSNDFTPSADIRNPRGTSLAIRHTRKFQLNRIFSEKFKFRNRTFLNFLEKFTLNQDLECFFSTRGGGGMTFVEKNE